MSEAKPNYRLLFPGQYYDAETGLHYNYFRYYDPKTGRYFRADPIGLEGGINLFVYAMNNPILFIDPYGLDVFDQGSYTFKKFTGDTMHGGEHWHVHKRRGGKLLGRVDLQGKVITGSVPKKALKILVKLGKVGGVVFGVLLEAALPANAGHPSDMIPLSNHLGLPPPSIELLPLISENESPCK